MPGPADSAQVSIFGRQPKPNPCRECSSGNFPLNFQWGDNTPNEQKESTVPVVSQYEAHSTRKLHWFETRRARLESHGAVEMWRRSWGCWGEKVNFRDMYCFQKGDPQNRNLTGEMSMINEISGFQHVPFFERSLEGVRRCMPHISYLNSMDWFKGNFTGKPHNYFFCGKPWFPV